MLPQTFANHTPVSPFIVLSITESTNNYAMAKLHAGMVSNGTCFHALHQTAGRGQRQKQWISSPGENITMTCVFDVSAAVLSNITGFPFILSASMALGCYDFIKDSLTEAVYIKWPNDVYVGDRKAAGLLIENVYRGREWTHAVVGVGLNVNQDAFPPQAGNAVSLYQVSGQKYDVQEAARQLHKHLLNRYHALESAAATEVLAEYNERLWGRNRSVRIKRKNVVSSAIIREATLGGELVVSGSVEQRLSSGDVEFMVP